MIYLSRPLRVLILICISLHSFNNFGIFYSHSHPSHQIFNGHNEWMQMLGVGTSVFFLSRLFGAYCIGKIADNHTFYKAMQIICVAHLLIGSLLCFFDIYDSVSGVPLFYAVHVLYTGFRFSILILPSIYLLRYCEPKKIYEYSGLSWTAYLIGLIAANGFTHIFPGISHKSWGVIYVIISAASLIIYAYIEDKDTLIPELDKKDPITSYFPRNNVLLAFLLIGAIGSGITYQWCVLEPYMKNIEVFEACGQSVIFSPFWITILLTAVPAVQIAKRLGIEKSLLIALLGTLFSISLFYILPLSDLVLSAQQVIFALFFNLLLSPSLAFVYQILPRSYSYFSIHFIHCASFSIFALVIIQSARLKIIPVPITGEVIVALLMTLAFAVSAKYVRKGR